MGRSRGGLTTKLHALVNADGLPLRRAFTAAIGAQRIAHHRRRCRRHFATKLEHAMDSCDTGDPARKRRGLLAVGFQRAQVADQVLGGCGEPVTTLVRIS